jgi:hypothetical protein
MDGNFLQSAPVYDTFHQFSELPTELKVAILRYRLLLCLPITTMSHPSHSAPVLLALVLTNKEIKSMALEIYYGENRVQIERRQNYSNPSAGLTWAYTHPAVSMWVRKLEVRLTIYKDVGAIRGSVGNYGRHWDRAKRNDWPFLVIEPDFHGIPTCAAWQQYFPNLTHMKISVKFHTGFGPSTCLGSELAPIVRDLNGSRVEVKTRELMVEVYGLYCHMRKGCGGLCANIVTQGIRSLVDIRERSHDRSK